MEITVGIIYRYCTDIKVTRLTGACCTGTVKTEILRTVREQWLIFWLMWSKKIDDFSNELKLIHHSSQSFEPVFSVQNLTEKIKKIKDVQS
jgi:hypothetical protein